MKTQGSLFEQMGVTYVEVNGYLIPNLDFTATMNFKLGRYGRIYLGYIKEHRYVLYINLLTSGKLNAYLQIIDENAKNLFDRLVHKIAERQGITEQLKSRDQFAWVGAMNNICDIANEIVLQELFD